MSNQLGNEIKRILEEKNQLSKNIQSLTDDNKRLTAEIEKILEAKNEYGNEIRDLREELGRVAQERELMRELKENDRKHRGMIDELMRKLDAEIARKQINENMTEELKARAKEHARVEDDVKYLRENQHYLETENNKLRAENEAQRYSYLY